MLDACSEFDMPTAIEVEGIHSQLSNLVLTIARESAAWRTKPAVHGEGEGLDRSRDPGGVTNNMGPCTMFSGAKLQC